MNLNRIGISFGTAMLILLAGCSPQGTSVPPTAAPTSTLAAVSLPGPEMKVGSTYLYVDGTTLVAVPAGPFTRGAGGKDNPVQVVTLSDFWIYATKVTNQQYALCVEAGLCAEPDSTTNPGYSDFVQANDPVVGVNYSQAAAYCTFVHARLPTEAEWEKTARGPDANMYPWGTGTPSCELLNYNNCVGQTTNVVTYPQGKSYYDALDMAGNSFEWVGDWYDPTYYNHAPTQDPPGPETGTRRVIRSSSYKSNAGQVPAANRHYDLPESQHTDLGFRCVVEDPTYFAPFCQTPVLYGQNGPQNGIPKGINFPKPVCEPVSISVQGGCGSPDFVFVYFGPPNLPADVQMSLPTSCSLVGSVGYCTVPGTASITGTCTVSAPPAADKKCSLGFEFNSNKDACVLIKGKSGRCLPGQVYDPVNQCCSNATGGAGKLKPVCPAGQYFSNSFNACMDWPAPSTITKSVPIVLPDCSGGNNGCKKPKGGCPAGYGWDSSTCACVCGSGHC